MKGVMKAIIYWMLLRPLILRNYAMRERGELPDEWYWADSLAVSWGYFTVPGWWEDRA